MANGLATTPKELVLLAQARHALEQAKNIVEVKDIRDKAEAIRAYAKQAGESLEVMNAAAEVKLRAERKAGDMLAAADKSKGGRPKKTGSTMEPVFKLADIGIGKKQSHRWQRIASVPAKKFEQHIEHMRESDEELTTSSVLKLAARAKATKEAVTTVNEAGGSFVTSLSELTESGLKFTTFYADPPWSYDNQKTRAATDNHYDTMSVDAICAEPVEALAADNAHLHLWTTNAFLFDAKRVMEAWGFEYKSCFVWVKPTIGIGNYWRVSHEFLLLGVRGSLPFRDKSLRSWLEVGRTKHSRKPYQVRDLIEKASPGPYLELYGREAIKDPTWTVYGNQCEELLV